MNNLWLDVGAFFPNFHKFTQHKGRSKMTEMIVHWPSCCQHMLIFIDRKKSSQTPQWLYHQSRKPKSSHFGTRTSGCGKHVVRTVTSTSSAASPYVISRYTLIARCVSLFEIKGTVKTLIGSASVASTQSPSMKHDNPPFPGSISPLIGLLSVLSNADNPFPFGLS